VLVLVSAGGIDVDESVADAVLWQPYGGQASGDGLEAVLFGDYSPSARLSQTFYKQEWADRMAGNWSTSILSFDLEVGQGRTHRYLKDLSLANHFFGFGLSYARFSYSGATQQHDVFFYFLFILG
jgi:beta-glucosidase